VEKVTVVSLRFTFRANSISSGFCLIANAAGKRKGWAGCGRDCFPFNGNTWRAKFYLQKESRICNTAELLAMLLQAVYYRKLIKSPGNTFQ